MGIHNFCKLLDCIHPPSSEIQRPFDSILFDVQSLLYTSIYYAFESDEKKFFREICRLTWDQISKTLLSILGTSSDPIPYLTIVLSFDGFGVPMKWPTQRQRRSKSSFTDVELLQGKRLYQTSLFGINTISLKVQEFVTRRLQHLTLDHVKCLTMIVCGCNVPGEGEHKLFHIAEGWTDDEGRVCCKNPVVVSIDQDVFVIALMRRHHYDSIQVFRYNKFYDLTDESLLKKSKVDENYPWDQFVTVSFLYGNDFAPCLVPITDTNGPAIHTALVHATSSQLDSDDETPDVLPDLSFPPYVICAFLNHLPHLKYERVAFVDKYLLVQFWLCYIWLADYYTKTEFQQKHMENSYYDRFDRNQVLTGLTTLKFSEEAYYEALHLYAGITTPECRDHTSAVFLDEDVRERLQRFWSCPAAKRSSRDTSCEVIRVTRRRSPEQTPTRARGV